jgi:predicted 3-demethylubiquinone-9 3-methyltransferase (glyoxalase superfamily)
MPKNVICLWYDGTAEDAAKFYAQIFPASAAPAVHRAPGDYPDGKEREVLTVEFTVLGVPCLGLNGGPAFRHSEAFSFSDRHRQPGRDGSLLERDRQQWRHRECVRMVQGQMGFVLADHPAALLDATTDPDHAAAQCAFEAMMTMKKIDIAAIEAARRGTARA